MHHAPTVVLLVVLLLGASFPPAFTVRFTTKNLDAARSGSPSSFDKTLEYAKKVIFYDRNAIFKAACDSSAFSCTEIIRLASFDYVDWGCIRWAQSVMVFAEGRSHKGCISDPANAKSIIASFDSKWKKAWSIIHLNSPDDVYEVIKGKLTQAFVTDNEILEPAKGVGLPPLRLVTGHRTDEDIGKLSVRLEQMMRGVFFNRSGFLLQKKYQDWLKRIRANGEQFSGLQLLRLVDAIGAGCDSRPPDVLAHAVSILLSHLEQFVTGVTCEEVNAIQRRATRSNTVYMTSQDDRLAGLVALKPNIIDAQNKAAIVADPVMPELGVNIAEATEQLLRDVGVGLPPKNNPMFGVVQGNPVIIVVDESDVMDVRFSLGHDTFTRRQFCHSQLEMVLEGLPNGTYFNVIQYGSFAMKIFERPALVSKTSIEAAMDKVSSTWRDIYTMETDPVKWLRKVHGFSLRFKRQFHGKTTKLVEALQLAYAMTDWPSQPTLQPALEAEEVVEREVVHIPDDNVTLIATEHSPQIYFLTSGQPHGTAGHILEEIDQLDHGRHIPVNCIVFGSGVADPLTKQFGKALASHTGGFFRSIEQD